MQGQTKPSAVRKARGTICAGAAAVIWTILSKSGWLPSWEYAFSLKPGFFRDPDIVCYCTIAIAWSIREAWECGEAIARAVRQWGWK